MKPPQNFVQGQGVTDLSLVRGMERRPASDDRRFRDGVFVKEVSKVLVGECVKGLIGEKEEFIVNAELDREPVEVYCYCY